MPKTSWFIIIIALIALVGFFIFYAKQIQPSINSNLNVLENVTYEPLANYVSTTTDFGLVVENKNVGLKFTVPIDWKARKITNSFLDNQNIQQGSILITSPDAQVDDLTNVAKKGCGFSLRVEKRESENKFKTIANLIEITKNNTTSSVYSLVDAAGRPALMETVFEDQNFGKAVIVSLPIENTIYIFETIFLNAEKDRCQVAFTDFLKNVEIK